MKLYIKTFDHDLCLLFGSGSGQSRASFPREVSWSLSQHDSNNAWCNYLMSRYGQRPKLRAGSLQENIPRVPSMLGMPTLGSKVHRYYLLLAT